MNILVSKVPSIDWNASGRDLIVQNVVNILNLYQTEIPYDRVRGIDSSVVDRSYGLLNQTLIQHFKEVIEKYEPRAVIEDISILENGTVEVILK